MSNGLIGDWVNIVMIVCILSMFLWRDNKAFRIAQTTLLAGAAAIAFIAAYDAIVDLVLMPMIKTGGVKETIFSLVSIGLGAMIYGTITKKYTWTSTIPLTFIVGTGFGLAFRTMVGAQLVDQVQATITSLNTIDSVVILACVFTVISYFVFSDLTQATGSKTLQSSLLYSGKIGRMVMMATFGTLFGTVAMTRIAWLMGQISKILQVLGLVPPY